MKGLRARLEGWAGRLDAELLALVLTLDFAALAWLAYRVGRRAGWW